MNQSNTELWIQSCIVSITFPTELDDLRRMVQKNIYKMTNFQSLFIDAEKGMNPKDGGGWSAPKWMSKNNIIFFYLTKSSLGKVKKMIKENPSLTGKLKSVLDKENLLTNKYAGSIFACGLISGAAHKYVHPEAYYKTRVLAPLASVHIFDNPLPGEQFIKFVKIARGNTTLLSIASFNGIKDQLAQNNKLPDYLERSKIGLGFRDVTKDNWREISCGKATDFINETQVREFLIDHLLREIKDDHAPIYEECRCTPSEKTPGFADYMVKIGGSIIPVEAKVNVNAENNVIKQIKKYTNIDRFTVNKGQHAKETISIPRSDKCLIVDQHGIYTVNTDGFLNCNSDKPLITRLQIGAMNRDQLRGKIAEGFSA